MFSGLIASLLNINTVINDDAPPFDFKKNTAGVIKKLRITVRNPKGNPDIRLRLYDPKDTVHLTPIISFQSILAISPLFHSDIILKAGTEQAFVIPPSLIKGSALQIVSGDDGMQQYSVIASADPTLKSSLVTINKDGSMSVGEYVIKNN